MKRSAVLGLRSTAAALAASACLVGGATFARADPAGGRTAPGSGHEYRSSATATCLDVPAHARELGSSVRPFDCKSAIDQQHVSTEVRTFTGSGMGTSPSQAVDGAARMAYSIAQGAGWQANQCYVRATDVRWVGGGVYSAVASLFCQR
ncbi:hypothetical protein OG897_29355 [Streptomyces sp. NBC_00237]|uniref:hypothetical protein n=1 Tax=Streptomyces sp. NBC_00237 TaxID=2975687 RepID=UPI00225C0E5B|nr:hypothetical protein [Streptomyces sp. NBC_00237]MCX5205555.1 hypothetical protein [Streptomyces sp. NBC_00237]